MKLFRLLVAAAALAYSSNAYAASFVQYTFTGTGTGTRYTNESLDFYVPALAFEASFYVDIEANPQGSNGGGFYTSNGKDRYFSFGPTPTELTYVSLQDGAIAASSTKQFPTDFAVSITVDFRDPVSSFADLTNGSRLLGGTFSYANSGKGVRDSAEGTITGFSVRPVDNLQTVDAFFTPVPEPTTWAMMLAGFGIIGAAARRRQWVKTTIRYT